MNRAACFLMFLLVTGAGHSEEVYGGLGTTGWVAGVTHQFRFPGALRLEGNLLRYSRSVDTSDINYDAKLKLGGGSLLFDVFPISESSFRFTAGIAFGNDQIVATGVPENGTYTINGHTVSAVGESITYTAKLPKVRPYLGMGLGHGQHRGLGFFCDLGATYGKPKVDLVATPGLVAAAGQANIDAEKQLVQDKVDKYKFYPVIKLGLTYAF